MHELRHRARLVRLKGRCRTCGTGISPLYPAVELATALLVAACAWKFGLTGEAAIAGFFCAVLVTVTATDLTHRIVPNRIVVPAAAIVLVAHTALEPRPEWALGALGSSFFLFAAASLATRIDGLGPSLGPFPIVLERPPCPILDLVDLAMRVQPPQRIGVPSAP